MIPEVPPQPPALVRAERKLRDAERAYDRQAAKRNRALRDRGLKVAELDVAKHAVLSAARALVLAEGQLREREIHGHAVPEPYRSLVETAKAELFRNAKAFGALA